MKTSHSRKNDFYDLALPNKLDRAMTEIQRVINFTNDIVLDGVTTHEDLEESIKNINKTKLLIQKFMFDVQGSWSEEDSLRLQDILRKEIEGKPMSEDLAVLKSMKEFKKSESSIRLRIEFLKAYGFWGHGNEGY